jgi:hypothetical protein
MGDEGPECWTVTDRPEWKLRTGHQILAVAAYWERLELGPARTSDGRIAEPARTVEVPVALRLDFAAGPVWLVAGIPTEKVAPSWVATRSWWCSPPKRCFGSGSLPARSPADDDGHECCP